MIKDSITSKRGRVFYWIERNTSDKCIVFIHGLTADHTLFDKQIDFWSRGYTVITFDMPLHGESRPYNDFTFYNVADDLKSILMKEKITHIVIAGQSAGGYVAQAFTQKYAKYVDAFIGIDTTPFESHIINGLKYFLQDILQLWQDYIHLIIIVRLLQVHQLIQRNLTNPFISL